MFERIIWIVLDSVGCGALPDAAKFGDEGAHTIGNTSAAVGGLLIPNLVKMGLGNIEEMRGVDESLIATACYGRAEELSNGKDTTTGHWEMAGIVSENPFPTYPTGFPKEIIQLFEEKTGTKIIGNKPASGTAILDELGEAHIKTGYPIVYTSGDSVFQIAAHEEVIPLERLYEMCRIARGILTGEHAVARVIARPFLGKSNQFVRTSNRRDFSLFPPYNTILDHAKEEGLEVRAVGKIEDIFNGKGITHAVHTKDNMDTVDKTLEYMAECDRGIVFSNLVDFDMLWGHRNNALGYAKGLEAFDRRLPEILERLREGDVLIINADHGCDPTDVSTDHTREYIPILVFGKKLKHNVNLGTRKTFADIGQTIAGLLNLPPLKHGMSFKDLIIR